MSLKNLSLLDFFPSLESLKILFSSRFMILNVIKYDNKILRQQQPSCLSRTVAQTCKVEPLCNSNVNVMVKNLFKVTLPVWYLLKPDD